ncbi:DNA cytosine methyltransferase [Nocardia cyriacigeorgica]|uniref:DNA cytosine methyltransferase n=1 Tax=Nocardia cyriacigeorgica TaxID=135487 RepID=UPI0018948124|nr:DNA cytosine methyltransferase [Nocardia cyriacigeorgica]MBF6085124.1 DNA cytosine methyltransferase [Nocardia cyriacigeorgica]
MNTAVRIGSMFTGSGALDLAAMALFPESTVAWHADNDPAVARVLARNWPGTPNHGDVTAIDWSSVEPVGILTAGFPCQDVSSIGLRAGLADGTRSGRWSDVRAAIAELRPHWVLLENVKGLLSASAKAVRSVESAVDGVGPGRPALRALGAVLGDLADIGFDAEWVCLHTSDVGGCHLRPRIFVLAVPAHATITAPHLAPRSATTAPASVTELLPTPRTSDANGGSSHGEGGPDLRTVATNPNMWPSYLPAIRRQEALTRPAPAPTEVNRNGRPRLSAAFAEWMMGAPRGWITDPAIGIARYHQFRIIGNAVVVAQAIEAFTHLLNRITGPASRNGAPVTVAA